MAQWYNTLTASGKLKAEVENTRQSISQAVWSNTGTGICELWRSSPDVVIDASGVQLDFNENTPSKDTLVRASGSWVADGFEAGDVITISDDGSDTNGGTYTLFSVVALTLTFVETDDVVDETNTTDTFTITNRGTKIFSFIKTAGEKTFHFPDALRGEAGDGIGAGDLYAVLPSTVTLWVTGRNSLIGD